MKDATPINSSLIRPHLRAGKWLVVAGSLLLAPIVMGADAIAQTQAPYPEFDTYNEQAAIYPTYEYVRPQAPPAPTNTQSINPPGGNTAPLPPIPIAPNPADTIPESPERARPPLSVRSSHLQAGTEVPVAISGDRIIFQNRREAVQSLEVHVQAPIHDSNGQLVIPEGTLIRGQLHPRPGGAQYIATLAVINDRAYNLRASSYFLEDSKDPTQNTPRVIALDTGIGAAAGAALSAIFTGGVGAAPVVGGAVLGATTGHVVAPNAVTLNEDDPFTLVLESPLSLSY